MKVLHFTCTSRTNFSYIFYKFTQFLFQLLTIHFCKIAAVATRIHALYLLELGSYALRVTVESGARLSTTAKVVISREHQSAKKNPAVKKRIQMRVRLVD